MIKKSFRVTGFILLTLLMISFITSCQTALDLLKVVFEKPKVTIKSFGLADANTDHISFNLILNIDNPNSVGIKTSGIDYNLDINQKDVINGILKNGINIQANGASDVEVPIQVNFQKLIQVVPSVLRDVNNVNYKVFGVINFDTPIGSVPINWQKEDKLDLPKLLNVF